MKKIYTGYHKRSDNVFLYLLYLVPWPPSTELRVLAKDPLRCLSPPLDSFIQIIITLKVLLKNSTH